MTEIQLLPLEESDREQFIKDNQEAFNYGALEEFGVRDDHFEEDGEIISHDTISDSIDDGTAYRIVQNGKPVGGVVIKTEYDQGDLELLFRTCQHDHRDSSHHADLLGIADPVRRGQDHLVAGVEQRGK